MQAGDILKDARLYDILAGLEDSHKKTRTFEDPKDRFAKLATGLLNGSRKRRFSVSDELTHDTKRTKSLTTQEEPDDGDSQLDKEMKLDSEKRKDSSEADELSRLRQLIDEDTESTRRDFVDKMTNLRRVYLYGLRQVAQLQDLRHAPDAILPGNIIPDLELLEAATEAPASSEPASG